ncbi:MAG: hypothetical protein F9K32_17555 [Desulfobulbaceae bacterium]|nr:MAG: hypothetical protein F9K32_17555 [Desulfobulbaceae bacterium]
MIINDKIEIPKSAATAILRLMHLVELNVRDDGITSTTKDGSMCFFRPVYDKPSATTYGMRSAINEFRHGPCFRKLYCIEQYNESEELVKFNVRLTDENNNLLGEWHLDISHGLHTHPIEDGRKGNAHIPFPGSVVDVALDISKKIKMSINF